VYVFVAVILCINSTLSSFEAHRGLFSLKDHFHRLDMVSCLFFCLITRACAVNVGGSECTDEPDGKAYFFSRNVLLDEGGKT
jgi:hypothetical protein